MTTTASKIKRGAVLRHNKSQHLYAVLGVHSVASPTQNSDLAVTYECLDRAYSARFKYNLDGYSRPLDEFDDLCLIGEAGEYRRRFEYVREATAAEMTDVCGGGA